MAPNSSESQRGIESSHRHNTQPRCIRVMISSSKCAGESERFLSITGNYRHTGHEDQKGKQCDQDVQQAGAPGILHTVECQVLKRLDLWRILEALKSYHPHIFHTDINSISSH